MTTKLFTYVDSTGVERTVEYSEGGTPYPLKYGMKCPSQNLVAARTEQAINIERLRNEPPSEWLLSLTRHIKNQ